MCHRRTHRTETDATAEDTDEAPTEGPSPARTVIDGPIRALRRVYAAVTA